jgi:hypothetical protein
MNNSTIDIRRRRMLLDAVTAIASLLLLRLAPNARAEAAALPHLAEDDPTAKALKYHQDATAAPRVDKGGVPAKDQFCHNCRFVQTNSGDWRPCQIFPGKAVNANGWCSSWMQRSG